MQSSTSLCSRLCHRAHVTGEKTKVQNDEVAFQRPQDHVVMEQRLKLGQPDFRPAAFQPRILYHPSVHEQTHSVFYSCLGFITEAKADF